MKICYTKLRSSHSDGEKTLKLATKHASGLATAATGRLFARLTCPKSLCAINHSRNNKRINAAFWWAHHIYYISIIYILYIYYIYIYIYVYILYRYLYITCTDKSSDPFAVAASCARWPEPARDVHFRMFIVYNAWRLNISMLYIYVIKYVYNIVVACFYNHITI